MQLSTLDTKHPAYDAERWQQLTAIAHGGKRFKSLLSVFLPRNPVEPQDVYGQRTAQAHFVSYVGSIINLYVSWLFAAQFNVRPYKRDTDEPLTDLDPFYGRFQENVGGQCAFPNFMRERFREALICHKAHTLMELPTNGGMPPESAIDYEARGLGNATLREVHNSDLWDFEVDDEGEYKWVILHALTEERPTPMDARDTCVETWRVYDRENVSTYQIRYTKKDGRPKQDCVVPQTAPTAPHGFKCVPLVTMHLPMELTIGESTFDAQVEHFRLDNALSWLIRRTCYAMPVLNLEDGDRIPTLGTGYAIALGPNDKFGWTSPPNAPFDVLQKSIDAKRDEIYRIVHQMAQGLDNNAETVARSAESKEIDAAATRIMLNAYGSFVAKTIEAIYEAISAARGDKDYEWSVEGFEGYDTATAGTLLSNIELSRTLGIPSQTFHREICTKAAMALLPGSDQRVKDKIREEIESARFEAPSIPLPIAKQQLEQAKVDGVAARAELDRAKAEAEPIKAKAAMKSASQPKPAPAAPPAAKAPPKG